MPHGFDENRIRDYLRMLGNPYASLQVRDVPETHEVSEPAGAVVAADPEQPRSSSSEAYTLREPAHGNPYASLANLDDEANFSEALGSPAQHEPEVSISAFEAGCRRIFARYIPAAERGRLRPEHRDFIERNRHRSAKIRAGLLAALQRFDLAELNVQPQFNRERPDLTAKKLLEIERSIATDS